MKLTTMALPILSYLASAALTATCVENPDQGACCQMEHTVGGSQECLFKGFIGAIRGQYCSPACERKFKELVEGCNCARHYSEHFQWLEAKKLCDPNGIYQCIADGERAEPTDLNLQREIEKKKTNDGGINPTIPLVSAGAFLVLVVGCAFLVLRQKNNQTAPSAEDASSWRKPKDR
eukprot:GEMP01105112.1.p1 GENE.GEMP01105112.1~~GEMP01105112.1.p1  ORF type:complete len:191 (+),score=20.80 GEMP01105112.1:44-574(+)